MFPLPPLTDAQRDVVERAATLARERFAPRAARYDAEAAFPEDNYADLHRAGLLALTVPREHGGVGADAIAYAHALREIARGCSATGLTFNMHATVVTFIAALGTEAQQRRYFGEIVGRGARVASITSEPEQSFRDRFVLNTVFRPLAGGGYHVAGVKQFCSLGDAADYYFVTGVLEGAPTALGHTVSALIPCTDAGVKIEGVWNATGMRGTVSHTIRYDSHVAPDAIIGPPGGLLTIDLSGFALGYAAVYLGIGQAAFDFTVEYARTRAQKPSPTPMSHHPLVQRTVAEMGTAIRTALLLLHEAARLRVEGDREATMLAVNQAKAWCADVGLDVTTRALGAAASSRSCRSSAGTATPWRAPSCPPRTTAAWRRRASSCAACAPPRSSSSREEKIMGLLDGKVAVITGASKGIGRVMSRLFAREGAAVVCAARSGALVDETATLVRKDGGRAVAVTGDAAKEADVQRMVAAGLETFGRIDTLVNNAGDGGPTRPVQEYTEEDWFYTINSCLTSSYMCIRFVAPEIIKAGGGAIVNITSMAGRRGLPYRIGYCSAKAGQVGMTYGMALELAPHNITVNAIAPGAIEGDRIDSVIAGQARVRGIAVEEMRRTMVSRSPLGRMSTAEDIAALAAFLCSGQARNISGQCIAVNAGEPAG